MVTFLKLTGSSHLKMDAWKTIVSFWGLGLLSGAKYYCSVWERSTAEVVKE